MVYLFNLFIYLFILKWKDIRVERRAQKKISEFTDGILTNNALVIVFPEGGGTPGCRWGNWGLCGDFVAYLCPRGGGNEGPLIY